MKQRGERRYWFRCPWRDTGSLYRISLFPSPSVPHVREASHLSAPHPADTTIRKFADSSIEHCAGKSIHNARRQGLFKVGLDAEGEEGGRWR